MEVVSTGYQKIPKERATGSFEFVDNKLLNRKVSTDILSRLEDIVPSISRDKSFDRGKLPFINVRGVSSMRSYPWPLIVVDGMPYQGDLNWVNGSSYFGSFNNINPNDIENIVVMVTHEDRQCMEKFYANNKFLKEDNVKLPTIVSDTLLKKYFPHQAVSHTVWIMNNEVKAISHPDFVNEENIQMLLDGKEIKIPIKDDFKINEVDEKTDDIEKSLMGSIQITGYNSKLNSTGLKYRYDSLQRMHVTYINNLDILGAFTAAWAHIKTPKYFLTKNRIVWEVTDPDRYFFDRSKPLPYHAWAEKNAICYERKDRLELPDTVRVQKVLEDLSDLLHLDVKWEIRKRPCLTIVNEGKADQKKIAGIPDNDSNLVEGAETLTGDLDFAGAFPPVFDESKYTGIIKVPNGYDLEKLNARLSYYGLKIRESLRDMEVLVIHGR